MNILKFDFKRHFKSLLIWSLFTSLVLIFFMSIFPSMSNSGMMDIVDAKIDAMPKVMLEMFNMKNMPDFSNILEYFAYCFQYIVMVMGIYGAILGVNSLVSEEAEGTIEFLYAKPVSRVKIALMKIITSILLYYVFIMIIGFVSFCTVYLLAPKGGDILKIFMDLKEIFLGTFLMGLTFMSVGVLISSLIKNIKQISALSLGLFFGTYILGISSKLTDNLEFLKWLSPYEQVIPSEVLRNGYNYTYLGVLIIVIIVSLIVSMSIYKKKDFKI